MHQKYQINGRKNNSKSRFFHQWDILCGPSNILVALMEYMQKSITDLSFSEHSV